ncbi:MAG TPA: LuxR C-terminal-related transcriptional regulator [Amycolatopsis sp.]|nr:LuxR C-terminal-related transcriptional regulator [Amycolatopsis sp.]
MTADVKRALSASRLVTLVGAGGVGKSRLAVHVAGQLRRSFPDGVCLVELAKVGDAAMVVPALVAALGLLDPSARDPGPVLLDYLAGKRMLLLLDNCEHVLDEAGRLAHRVLSSAPGVRVLATSREPLGIGPESVCAVPPLSVPGAHGDASRTPRELLAQYEAVALFEERAGAAVPGFAVTAQNSDAVVRLCQRLDGVPLALELAAVRVRVLSVEQILTRLEDRFRLLSAGSRDASPRHQTLRAAVDWSYDLCTESERILWARCSVFAGDFDLDAAENVCARDGLTLDDVFTGIAGLVDKSVLTRLDRGPRARYRMLETIRQYGAERLAETGGRDRFRRRHRDFCLALAEQSDFCGPRQAEWMKRLRAERPNLWAALDYCLTVPGEAATGLRLAAALGMYWVGSGSVRDGRYWLDRAVAAAPRPSPARARALWLTGWIAFLQGDNAASLELLTESHDLARRLGDQSELTYAIQYLGEAEMFAGNLARAVPLLDEALARHRANGPWTAPALLIFGQRARVAFLAGDVAGALALLEECEAVCASFGERWTLSWTKWNLAVVRWELGEYERAAGELRESLRIKEDLDDRLGIPFCVDLLAWVADSAGDAHRAAVLFGAAEKMWQRIGKPLFGFEILLRRRANAMRGSRSALGDRAYDTAAHQGARLSQREIIAYAVGAGGRTARAAADRTPEPAAEPALTRRERQVAELVATGRSNKEIAAVLVISQRTVESHVDHILGKLNFTSRTQIAAWLTERTATRARHDGP